MNIYSHSAEEPKLSKNKILKNLSALYYIAVIIRTLPFIYFLRACSIFRLTTVFHLAMPV